MRILIAVAGAPHSDTAIRLAAHIVDTTGATPTALTVRSPKSDPAQAGRLLSEAIQLLPPSSQPSSKTLTGRPDEQIIREAREGLYDLIVLGERPGRHLVNRIIGSTTQRVIAQAPCPVLIARHAGPLQHVLVCEAGRQPSLLQRLTSRLAPLLRGISQIVVLHVMSQMAAAPGVPDWELQAGAEEHIRQHTPEGELLLQDVQALARDGIQSEVKVRHGLVVDEILAEAEEGGYDLVVIGAHREEGWQRLLFDDLAQKIIVNTHQTLLVVV